MSKAEGPSEDDASIAYYTFLSSDDACGECRKWDGFCFLPSKRHEYRLPIATCQYPVCWCEIVGVHRDEGTLTLSGPGGESHQHGLVGGGEDIAEFLSRSGGTATNDQIDAHIDAQSARERERSTREAAGVDLYARAFRAEKVSIEQAIALYREGVVVWKAALGEEPDCEWDYLEESYNRLTLALERSRRFHEAIGAIDDYKAFRALMGRKVEVGAISKRETRLRKRIARGARHSASSEA